MTSTSRPSIVDTAKSTFVINDFISKNVRIWSSQSSEFNVESLRNRFHLGIFPKCTFQKTDDEVLFCLWSRYPKASVQYRVSILDASGVKHCTREVIWNFLNEPNIGVNNHQHSIIRLVPRAYLLDPANGLLPDGKLTIYCEVDILSCKIPSIPESTFQSTNKLEDSIQKDFEFLLESGKLSDVVLVVGQKELHAHKNILTARSKVFGAMFENKEMTESMENRVEIPDVEVEVFEEMLMYIYTGKIPSSINENALELLVASDKYELDHLKSICEQSLGSSLTIESVVRTLVVADMHQVAYLKSKCIDYITEHSTSVMATDGWNKFIAANQIELLHQLFQAISAKFDSKK